MKITSKLIKIILIGFIFIFISCKKDKEIDPGYVNFDVPLSYYSQVFLEKQHIIIETEGLKGIVIYKISDEEYVAFDLKYPDPSVNECEILTIENNLYAVCDCNDCKSKFYLVDGSQAGECPSKKYLIEYNCYKNKNVLRITN